MDKNSKILITGATGLTGSAIKSKLRAEGYKNIISPTRKELDYTRKFCVNDYFKEHRPEFVFHCAGEISTHLTHGTKIQDSSLLSNDAYINLNTINAAAMNSVKKIIAVGSCWNYPRTEKVLPGIKESDYDTTSSQDNTGHGISKFLMISLLALLRQEDRLDSTVLMIPPLYGDDTSDETEDKHVFAHFNNNIHVAAKKNLGSITFTSNPTNLRQLLHTEDFAEAALMAMGIESPLLNVASEDVYSMEDIVKKLCRVWDYKGDIKWNNRPSNKGPQMLDCSLLKSKGWQAKISFNDFLGKRLK